MNDDDKAKVAVAQAIKHAQDNWAQSVQIIELKARTAFARFVALKKQGFSVSEALTLCIKDIEL